MDSSFERESGYRGRGGMWELRKDLWLLEDYSRLTSVRGRSRGHMPPIVSLLTESHRLFGGLMRGLLWVCIAGGNGRDGELGSIIGRGSWEGPAVYWKFGAIISNRKDSAHPHHPPLMGFSGVGKITSWRLQVQHTCWLSKVFKN